MTLERFETESEEATMTLGRGLAAGLVQGGVVLLHGELGAGKTVLAKAIFAGLGFDPGQVTSPTFQLANRYRELGPSGPALYHVDLYRIDGQADLESLGLDEMSGPGSVVVVEWAERMPRGWLEPRLRIHISAVDEDRRQISVEDLTPDPRLPGAAPTAGATP